jgi:hypothetical protein
MLLAVKSVRCLPTSLVNFGDALETCDSQDEWFNRVTPEVTNVTTQQWV